MMASSRPSPRGAAESSAVEGVGQIQGGSEGWAAGFEVEYAACWLVGQVGGR